MKEITSKKTGKIQIIPDYVWDEIVKRGWMRRYKMVTLVEKKLNVPTITKPIEIKTKTKKSNG